MKLHIKNTFNSYGIITKALHFIIVILFIIQYTLVYWRKWVADELPFNMQLILLHKSLGFTLLLIGLLFIFWRFVNVRPAYPNLMAKWEIVLAKATQHSLYLIIFLIPLSGAIMSFASGRGISWFGHPVPNIFKKNEIVAGVFHSFHIWLSYIAIAFVVLHTLGALKHFIINRDKVLQRMWR